MWMPWAEYWFNTTYHGSTGMSPFEAVYGRQPPKIVQVVQGEVKMEAVQKDLMERDEVLRQLKTHLLRAQDRMRVQANKHRRERNFEVGDLVFLKLKQNRQHSVMSRVSPKLSAKYYGPFEVVERIGGSGISLEFATIFKDSPSFSCVPIEKGSWEIQG